LVVRTEGGYIVNHVERISTDTPYIPLHSSHSDSGDTSTVRVSEDVGDTRARARAAAWLTPCRDYANHQSAHRQTAQGWICGICQGVA
jgi:hypothetical protein